MLRNLLNHSSPLIVVGRHDRKEKVKVIPGSAEDKAVPLSIEGMKASYDRGEKIIKPYGSFGFTVAVDPDFLRTFQTVDEQMAGAGYSGEIQRVIEEKIGLAAANWGHPDLPPYNPEPARENAFIAHILPEFYFSRGDDAPCMARHGADMIGALVKGYEAAKPMIAEGQHGVIGISTSGPFMDAFANALFGYLIVDEEKRTARLDRFSTEGNYRYGDMMVGGIYSGAKTDNPTILMTGKDLETTVTMDRLKGIQETLYRHADMQR